MSVRITEGTTTNVDTKLVGTVNRQVIVIADASDASGIATVSSIDGLSVKVTNPVGSVVMTSGTISSLSNISGGTIGVVSNITNGSIVVTAGTVIANVGDISGGTIDLITDGTVQVKGGTIGVISSLSSGSVAVIAGTIASVGTILGIGTVTNIGTLNMLNGGTINNIGTVIGIGTISNVGTIKARIVDATGADMDLFKEGDNFAIGSDHGLAILGLSDGTPKQYSFIRVEGVDSDSEVPLTEGAISSESYSMNYNGTVWSRVRGDTTNGLWTNVKSGTVTVTGNLGTITNIGSISTIGTMPSITIGTVPGIGTITNIGSISTIGTMPAISVGNPTGGTTDLLKSGTITTIGTVLGIGGTVTVSGVNGTFSNGTINAGTIGGFAGSAIAVLGNPVYIGGQGGNGTIYPLLVDTSGHLHTDMETGTITSVTTISNLTNGSVRMTVGTITSGSITNLGTLMSGTISMINAGTITSSGTTTGVGTISNIGSIGMLNGGTVQANIVALTGVVLTTPTAIGSAGTAFPIPATALSGRKSILCYNSGTVTVYIGGGTVSTAAGIPVGTGSYSPALDIGTTILYGIVGANTVGGTLISMEVS